VTLLAIGLFEAVNGLFEAASAIEDATHELPSILPTVPQLEA
jgi:hypothetical protein